MRTALSGLCLLALARLAVAQDATPDDIDAIEPAVDTSVEDFQPAVSSEDLEALDGSGMDEPAVDTLPETFTADVRERPVDSSIMDELDLGATEITGNQELPKVLYIVPWRQSDPGDLMGQPANTLLDEVLAPVDRREFTREVDYYSDLFESDAEQ